jgi:hypothetical protein
MRQYVEDRILPLHFPETGASVELDVDLDTAESPRNGLWTLAGKLELDGVEVRVVIEIRAAELAGSARLTRLTRLDKGEQHV